MRSYHQHKQIDIAVTERKSNPDVVVFGMGKTGLSVANFLRTLGQPIVMLDTREDPPGLTEFIRDFPDTEYLLGAPELSRLDDFRQLVLSPGISRSNDLVSAAVARGIEVIGDIELFSRCARKPIIAITGSNGKSSVVTLVTEMINCSKFRALSGGNLGVPALDLLRQPEPDFYVLELSSFQLESVIDFAPHVACILNVSPDHMDRYPDFASYASTKSRIYAKADQVVLNADDPMLRSLAADLSASWFSLASAPIAHYRLLNENSQRMLAVEGKPMIDTAKISVNGLHNYANVLAALAITDLIGLDREAQLEALMSFRGLAHRTERIGRWNEVEWVNDSKGTNVGATLAALTGTLGDKNGILIAGGIGKGADFSALLPALSNHVHTVVLFGRDATEMAQAFDGVCDIHQTNDLNGAVRLAKSVAKRGDTVLFSPACASFDMFTDFVERGDAFKRAVISANSK